MNLKKEKLSQRESQFVLAMCHLMTILVLKKGQRNIKLIFMIQSDINGAAMLVRAVLHFAFSFRARWRKNPVV